MRSTFAISGLLAAWTTAVVAFPTTKGEGYISSDPTSVHNLAEADNFIVLYEKNETTPIEDLIARLDDIDDTVIVRRYNNSQFYGAEIKVGKHCADAFSAMAEVAMVEAKVEIKTYLQKTETPWGLQRISNEAGASGDPSGQGFTYSFEDEQLGAGVDIYVVDTGVRTSHAVFTGRISEGFSFTDSVADGDGHGTHVAGTAAGTKFGVAQGANIIAVKVLGDDGSGSSADTIAGMDWIINRHQQRKQQAGFKGSIMSMSWGLQGTAAAVDQVVLEASEAGIHISVAAGNDGADACQSTPSHNGGPNSAVVSVGSVNIDNEISSFSNIGSCVDIYAPGEQILSSWAEGDNVINFLSGTSMACPHVSGVMAYLIAQDVENLGQNPAALKTKLLATARVDAITGNTGGSANLLLSNGVDGKVPTGSARLAKKDERWNLRSVLAQLRY